MHVLSASQIHEWDAFTILNEPVTADALMERAAFKAASFIKAQVSRKRQILVLCGPGNNGADGLVIARLLNEWSLKAKTYLLTGGLKKSDLCEKKWVELSAAYPQACEESHEPKDLFASPAFIENGTLVIDALFGTSLRLPLPEFFVSLIDGVNDWKQKTGTHGFRESVISIDMPSGLKADSAALTDYKVIKADRTLTFQCFKESFLLPDTGAFCGFLEVLDIGLHPGFLSRIKFGSSLLEFDTCYKLFKVRSSYSYKGTFGHSLVLAGSKERAGALVLCTKGCLHAGTGLVSAFLPESIRSIFLTQVPEAMALLSESDDHAFGTLPQGRFTAIAIGPGLGRHPETDDFVRTVLAGIRVPVVIDADALNVLASDPDWVTKVPVNAVLTPHVGEFDRLAGPSESDFERLQKQHELSRKTGAVIVLKGFRTSICLPDGATWFNTSGNPGMATGGSGDTLTGIITALLSQGYSTRDAALIGVHIHGIAGDLAAREHSETALSAGMLSDYLGAAFLVLEQ